jgi:hypothetical protein
VAALREARILGRGLDKRSNFWVVDVSQIILLGYHTAISITKKRLRSNKPVLVQGGCVQRHVLADLVLCRCVRVRRLDQLGVDAGGQSVEEWSRRVCPIWCLTLRCFG